MAEQMMKEKWMMTFMLMDFNHDNLISSKDRDDCKASFQATFQPEGDQIDTMMANLDKLWDISVFLLDTPDWSKSFNMEEFVQFRKKWYSADKEGMVNAVRKALEYLLLAADFNGTKSFSLEEFLRFHKAFNIQNEKFVKDIHELVLPDESGSCSLDNVLDFYSELIVGEDVAKHGKSKQAFVAAGFM